MIARDRRKPRGLQSRIIDAKPCNIALKVPHDIVQGLRPIGG